MKKYSPFILFGLLVLVTLISSLRLSKYFGESQITPTVAGVTNTFTDRNDNPVITVSDIAQHNIANDCWLIVEGFAYNMTEFMKIHPGGSKIITELCGKDATDVFENRKGIGGHPATAEENLINYLVGKVN